VLRLWEGWATIDEPGNCTRRQESSRPSTAVPFQPSWQLCSRYRGLGVHGGAILSIAQDAREPILEANTIRLLSRLLAYRGDPWRSAGQQLLWTFAKALLPRRSTGVFNQALMELGSTICTPRDLGVPHAGRIAVPHADERVAGLVPPPKSKKRYEEVSEAR